MTTYVSKYLQDARVNWFRGVAYPTALTNVYIALVTTAPTARDATGLVECTGGSYARQAIANAGLPAASTSGSGLTAIEESSNSAQVSFAGMPACTVVGVAYYDAVSAGNFLGYSDLTGGSQAVSAGATFNLPASNITIEEL